MSRYVYRMQILSVLFQLQMTQTYWTKFVQFSIWTSREIEGHTYQRLPYFFSFLSKDVWYKLSQNLQTFGNLVFVTGPFKLQQSTKISDLNIYLPKEISVSVCLFKSLMKSVHKVVLERLYFKFNESRDKTPSINFIEVCLAQFQIHSIHQGRVFPWGY